MLEMACRSMSALPTKPMSAHTGLCDSFASSPRIHAAKAKVEEGAGMAGQSADRSQTPAAASEKRAALSSRPGPGDRSGQPHSRSLSFSVPTFPMPEPQGCRSRAGKTADAATASSEAQAKSRGGLLHGRAGQVKMRPQQGGAEQPKTGPRWVGAKSAMPSGLPAGEPAAKPVARSRAGSPGPANAPAAQPAPCEYAGRLNLRSAVGQSIAAAVGWETSSNASKQAVYTC